MALGRDQILNADDTDLITVNVPEWRDPSTGDDTVLVRPLSGNDRDDYEAGNWRRGRDGAMKLDLRGSRARLAAVAIVDSDGRVLFTRDDVKALGRKSAAALDRVVDAARDASGLDDDTVEASADSFDEATLEEPGERSY